MAALDFVPVTVGPRTASNQLVLKTAAALTNAYAATTNTANTIGWEYVVFSLAYTNGTETTIQVKPQGYDGTTWQDLSYKAAQGSGVSELTPDVVQLTAATFATAYGSTTLANIALPPVSVLGFQQVRLVLKANTSSTTGTVGVTATAGVTVKK